MTSTHLNFITIFALFSWPLVALLLYKTRPVGDATLWTILGGYMLLPAVVEVKFPMIPALDKTSIPNVAAFLGCILATPKTIRLWYGFGLVEICVLALVIGPFVTSELNADQVVVGGAVLPGATSYDAGSAVIFEIIDLLPFFVGRQILRSALDTENILRVLLIAGIAYSPLILLEVRLSPQLHTWIYGYFPSSFAQALRDGGFRPVVFMGHGLLVSFFVLTTAIAAAAFWRTNTRVSRLIRMPLGGVTAYLSGVLILCKTLSALAYGVVLVPLVRFAKPKLQVKIAVALVSVALLYPILRVENLVPTDLILRLAASVSTERADSLNTRFTNEDQLLERASQRFLFGWGRFGRDRIYDDFGNDISLADGRWIITMGQFGLIGFLAEFGLLALPVFRALSALRLTPSFNDKVFLAALTLILAINVFDLLPNSPLRPWTWLVAGALLGRAESVRAFARRQRNSLTQNLNGHSELSAARDFRPLDEPSPGPARY